MKLFSLLTLVACALANAQKTSTGPHTRTSTGPDTRTTTTAKTRLDWEIVDRYQTVDAVRTSLDSKGQRCLDAMTETVAGFHSTIRRWEQNDPSEPWPSREEVEAQTLREVDQALARVDDEAERVRVAFTAANLDTTRDALAMPRTRLADSVPAGLRNCTREYGALRELINGVVDDFATVPERIELARDARQEAGTTAAPRDNQDIVDSDINSLAFEAVDQTDTDRVCEFAERVGSYVGELRTRVDEELAAVRETICTKGAAFARSQALRDWAVCVSNDGDATAREALKALLDSHVGKLLRLLRNKCAQETDSGDLAPLRLRFKRRIKAKRIRTRTDSPLSDQEKTTATAVIEQTARERNPNLGPSDVTIQFKISTHTDGRRLSDRRLQNGQEDMVVEILENDQLTETDYNGVVDTAASDLGFNTDGTTEEPIELDEFTIAEIADQRVTNMDGVSDGAATLHKAIGVAGVVLAAIAISG